MFQIFDNNIRSIHINLPVRMDGKIPENGDIISFRNWLWVMFIPVPRVRDFALTTNVPMQILAYSVMSSCTYSVAASLEHPKIMWSMVSIFSSQSLHLGSTPLYRILAW